MKPVLLKPGGKGEADSVSDDSGLGVSEERDHSLPLYSWL